MDLSFLNKKGNYNFKNYFERYQKFFVENYNSLITYWKNFETEIDFKILEEFDYLYKEYDNMIVSFQQLLNNEADNINYFNIAELLADMKSNLDYVKNLPKWLKTSDNYVDVFEEPYINYVVKQGDTLENISEKFYGNSEDFYFIMSYNNIRYNDVDAKDWIGKIIKIPARKKLIKDVESVFDALIGEKILGKDINKNFNFQDNDISNVEYDDCFQQAIQILLQECPRTAIPEFPKIGNNTYFIIGSNLGDLSFPMLKNDLESLMKIESTLKDFKITNMKIEEDSLRIEFSFESILGEVFFDSYVINKSIN